MVKNWLARFLRGQKNEEVKETFATRADKINRISAYAFQETMEETIQKDWLRLVQTVSNFVLAEKIAELELQGNGYPEKFASRFQEVYLEVQKDRKKAEDRLYKLIPRHSQLDKDEFFSRVHEQCSKEVDAKNRALKKSAEAHKWKEGDRVAAKLDCSEGTIAYINMDDKLYTIIMDGTMAPTYYSWEDAHETFDLVKEPTGKKVATSVFVLEAQDEKGFWNPVRKSSFLPELQIKAELMAADKEVNLRISESSEMPAPKFEAGQEVNDGNTTLKIVQVDDKNGIYQVTMPGRALPVRYTFETAHATLRPGAKPSLELRPPMKMPEGEAPPPVGTFPAKEVPPVPEMAERSMPTAKLVDDVKLSLKGNTITATLPNEISTVAVFVNKEEAAAKFASITSIKELKNAIDYDILVNLEREAGSFIPPDVFHQIVADARENKLDASKLAVKYPQLTPKSIEKVLELALVEPPKESEPNNQPPQGGEGTGGRMGTAPMQGGGVFVEPGRGGDNVMSPASSLKAEGLQENEIIDAVRKHNQTGKQMSLDEIKNAFPHLNETQVASVHEKAVQSSLEEGNTFTLGEVAILNTKVGALEEGSEVIVIGAQNSSVVFESAHNPLIKGFTKFSKLDKIAKEKYQWINDDISVKFDVGDSVRVGAINLDGKSLKGAEGKVIEVVLTSPTEGVSEMYYRVDLGCCVSTFPGEALKKIKSVKASLGISEMVTKADLLPGGKADNKTPEDIAKKHNLPLEEIKKQIELGREVEKEHTLDEARQLEIILDHLCENGEYYQPSKGVKEDVLLVPAALKESVQKANMDVVREFYDSFKVPPTVVSDVMVKEWLQTQNLTASKEDLKEIYQLLQSNNVEVRISVAEPELASPKASSLIAAKEIGPKSVDQYAGFTVGDKISYKITSSEDRKNAEEILGVTLPKDANSIEGRLVRLSIQEPVKDSSGKPTDPDAKEEILAHIMWDNDLGVSHGVELDGDKMSVIAAKYRADQVKPDGTRIIVEKEIPTLEAPEVKVKNPDGTDTTFKKL